MAARVWGLFSLYIYIENLKKKNSCQNPLDRFQYNTTEMFFWWSSSSIVQAIMIRQKIIAAKRRGLFWKIFLFETVRPRASKFGM